MSPMSEIIRITVILSKEERKLIKVISAQLGVTMSDFVLKSALEKIAKNVEVDKR